MFNWIRVWRLKRRLVSNSDHRHSCPPAKTEAAKQLAHIRSRYAWRAMLAMLIEDRSCGDYYNHDDPSTFIIDELNSIAKPWTITPLIIYRAHPQDFIRKKVDQALTKYGVYGRTSHAQKALPYLFAALERGSKKRRYAAINAIYAFTHDNRRQKSLLAAADDYDWWVAGKAVDILAAVGDLRAIPVLEKVEKKCWGGDGDVAKRVREAIPKIRSRHPSGPGK